jgi:hypothetical protein
MRTSHKLLGAALVVGVLAATGSAFTGTSSSAARSARA